MRAKVTTTPYPGGVNIVIEAGNKAISVSKANEGGLMTVATTTEKSDLFTTDPEEVVRFLKGFFQDDKK